MTKWDKIQRKIVSKEEAIKQVAQWKKENLKVGFTNGCFDILHQGHVVYLAKAASKCNNLVVGVNADASVKRLKGEERPINSESSRALLIASLEAVDLVIIFGEDTPLELITSLQPSTLIKGADYDATITDEKNPKYVVGANEVKAYQGEVITVTLEEGFSTTNLIQQLRK